ncbi:MAG: T9SS type A sorting domain-containing protein [Bacteroidetes bacterium]|nr:T9SS type A sorting domain-containing protein [Bacteroidota bacterium]
MSHRLILLLLLAFPGFAIVFAQSVDHWETIIQTGDSVKYIVPDSDLPSDWNTLEFNDSLWNEGISGIGYGDDDDGTVIDPCISVYIRYKFSIPDLTEIESLLLDMDFDDAFVAYLNGVEIARANIGVPFTPPAFDQSADGFVEAALYNGQLPGRYEIDSIAFQTLVAGENVFSVEVHNEDIGSSDLSSNAFLHAGIKTDSVYFSPLPDWFVWTEPIFFSGELPVISINTNGQTILNDPRIVADMGIIDNGAGFLNHPDDPFNNYDGKISIEIRGASSQIFPKKSYTIETQTDSGTNNNVPLLGLPKENDWVLYAPYCDKSLVRNVISFSAYEQMGHYSPRTRYIDLYINQDYKGVYVLIEKVKQDKNRVDIKKLKEADVSATGISGGYILQVDRTVELLANEYWTSPVVPSYPGFLNNHFEYFDPGIDELTPDQSSYIREWINDLDEVFSSDDFYNESIGYRQYIDVKSFVDFLIFHEFNKDVDAYRLSAFFYKASDFKGGKLHAGPPWDYNLTYGNLNYGGDIRNTYGWMYNKTTRPYWWQRLIDDPWFQNQVNCRWESLKEGLMEETHLHHLIDSSIQVMDLSIDYNFQRWPVLGEWVWPNDFIGNTHAEEITFLKDWISDRLQWLDLQWGGQCVMTSYDQRVIEPLASVSIAPNPSDLSHSRMLFSDAVSGDYLLTISDMNGRTVHQESLFLHSGSNEIMLEDLSYLSTGVYLVSVTREDGFTDYLKIMKN